MKRSTLFKGFVIVAVLAVTLAAVAVLALPRPRPIPGPICPNSNIYCLDVWDPVTCSNGVTYSNMCYAMRACATGCVPGYPAS